MDHCKPIEYWQEYDQRKRQITWISDEQYRKAIDAILDYLDVKYANKLEVNYDF